MKTAILSLLLFVIALPGTGHTKGKPYNYLAPDTIDVKTLISDPPADGSPEALKDIAIVYEKQQSRTEEDVARARADQRMTPDAFAGVIGAWFTNENLPETYGFLKKVQSDSQRVSEKGKKLWHRSRPPVVDTRIEPVINLPSTSSYPSGHSLQGMIWGMVLAELAPDLKDALYARGEEYGDSRVIGGVHFPSDIAAGRILAKSLANIFLNSPEYQDDRSRAKAEFDSVRKAHEATTQAPETKVGNDPVKADKAAMEGARLGRGANREAEMPATLPLCSLGGGAICSTSARWVIDPKDHQALPCEPVSYFKLVIFGAESLNQGIAHLA